MSTQLRAVPAQPFTGQFSEYLAGWEPKVSKVGQVTELMEQGSGELRGWSGLWLSLQHPRDSLVS